MALLPSPSEPSDAVRVVNAMLTQLDALKRFPNVITLCTSNLAEAVDVAFIDRADIKQHIGLPPVQARYTILRGALLELMRVGIVVPAAGVATTTGDSMSSSSANSADRSTKSSSVESVLSRLEQAAARSGRFPCVRVFAAARSRALHCAATMPRPAATQAV